MTPMRACVAALVASLAAGCMVGPDYVKPSVPEAQAYKEPPPEAFKAAGTWTVAQPSERQLGAKWWEAFGDPQLNALEEQLTAANQNLKVAEAHLRQARALVGLDSAAEFPTVSVSPSIESLRDSRHRPYFTSTKTTGDFVLPFDLSYEVDLWGRVRRTVTAAGEEAQATAADLATASLSLHAELALDYFDLRSADAQEQLLDDTVKDYAQALDLTENRASGGAAPESDVAEARTQLDTTNVELTDVGVERAQYEHAIAVLTGQPPSSFALAPSPLALNPPVVPVGIPSELLQRRPDIAAAERRVAEANEQIGIAKAAYYPSLLLDPTVGFEGDTISTWFLWPSLFWAVGPSMSETLFDGGLRKAASLSALAGYDATVATYRETTLDAFQQVEDNLAALRILEREARQQAEAVASAKNSEQLSTQRYVGGRDTYLQVITTQTLALANERNESDILRRRMEASVLLVKALGGGWTASDLPTLDALKTPDGSNTRN